MADAGAAELAPSAARRLGLVALLGALAATLLTLLALAAGIDHDEDQYVAAAQLALTALPYHDFAYLQTPLQPLLLAPVALVPPGLRFPAFRLVSAGLGLLALALLYGAQRQLGVPRRDAALAVLLAASTHAFLFGASHARNDMLPLALFAGAIWLAAAALERPRLWLAAGVLAGAATCAKISYGPPAAALGLFLALDPARRRWLAALVLGGLLGALPALPLALAAPQGFFYGVLEYPVADPRAWYAAAGDPWRLTLGAKLAETLWILVRGPALAMLVLILLARFGAGRSGGTQGAARRDAVRMLDLLILGGLAAALLPTPTYRQYFVPLLAPLAVRFGLLLVARPPGVRGWAALTATALLGAMGLGELGRAAATGHWPALASAREAAWVGAQMRAAGSEGTVATLTGSRSTAGRRSIRCSRRDRSPGAPATASHPRARRGCAS